MRIVIALHKDGTVYAILENQCHIPSVGDNIVLSSGRYVVVDVIWMYALKIPNVTVDVELVV